ncbi:hypothetical protein AX14_013791 [Amanita brunnescens Koide BX004]|nr:hypothetical protein AX14_013791 [Amanita brunnescens Koide BX004]
MADANPGAEQAIHPMQDLLHVENPKPISSPSLTLSGLVGDWGRHEDDGL